MTSITSTKLQLLRKKAQTAIEASSFASASEILLEITILEDHSVQDLLNLIFVSIELSKFEEAKQLLQNIEPLNIKSNSEIVRFCIAAERLNEAVWAAQILADSKIYEFCHPDSVKTIIQLMMHQPANPDLINIIIYCRDVLAIDNNWMNLALVTYLESFGSQISGISDPFIHAHNDIFDATKHEHSLGNKSWTISIIDKVNRQLRSFDYPGCQIFFGEPAKLGCDLYMRFFWEMRQVAPRCLSCFKIEFRARDIGQIFAIHDQLGRIKQKCWIVEKGMIELRSIASLGFKHIIYFDSAKSMTKCLDQIKQSFDSSVEYSPKFGCSEFKDYQEKNSIVMTESAIPTSKINRLKASTADKWTDWQSQAKIPLNLVPERYPKPLLSLANALTLRNWLQYEQLLAGEPETKYSQMVSDKVRQHPQFKQSKIS